MTGFLKDRQSGVYRASALEPFAWLEHGFAAGDTRDWPGAGRLATAHQVHSATVLTAVDGPGQIGTGDALITNLPGRPVGVRTADCVPILLADTRRRVVAAVHAGWKGTAEAIVRCTISEMVGRFGTAPADLLAAIGPCIGKCCYEVGPEVARRFAPWIAAMESVSAPIKLDLAEVNRRQAIDSGVPLENVFAGAPCTFCTAGGEFHSFRRDRERAGRMLAWIGIRKH